MNMKLFLSTFALIFLAELGDKTQLASMARAATGDGSKWTVFAAASSALVASTLLAVLFGAALTRLVPPQYIKLAAGALFIVFGVLLIADIVRQRAAAPEGGQVGVVGRAVLRIAAQFEEAAWSDYRALAARASAPDLKALLETLAREEAQHLDRVRSAELEHAELAIPEGRMERLPPGEALSHDVSASDRPLLQHVMEHEEATARFYEELARVTHMPGLKGVFATLASEERGHLRRIREFAGTSPA